MYGSSGKTGSWNCTVKAFISSTTCEICREKKEERIVISVNIDQTYHMSNV